MELLEIPGGSNTHVLTILESPTHFHNSVAKTSRQTADTLRNSADGSILAAAATGEVMVMITTPMNYTLRPQVIFQLRVKAVM